MKQFTSKANLSQISSLAHHMFDEMPCFYETIHAEANFSQILFLAHHVFDEIP